MPNIDYSQFAETFLKALSADESLRVIACLQGLPPEKAQSVQDTGEVFHRSGTVNGTWFWRTVPELAAVLPEADFTVWLTEGAGICRGNWEVALSFLKAGPDLAKHVQPAAFINWMQIGRGLTRFSNQDAIWYFKHSGDILKSLAADRQHTFTGWLRQILIHSWPAAVACLKNWPAIVRYLPEDRWADILQPGLQLTADLPDDAAAYFRAAPAFLKQVGIAYLEPWAAAAININNVHRGVAAAYFAATPGLAEKTEPPELAARFTCWADWGNRLAAVDSKLAEVFLLTTPLVLKSLAWPDLEKWVGLTEQVQAAFSVQGAIEFVKSSPELLAQLDVRELAGWVAAGLETTRGEKRMAFFSLKSQESRDTMVRLRSGLHLEAVKKVLLLYCEGITGEAAVLRKASDLPGKIHGDDRLFCTLDTRRVYLPDMLKVFSEEQENFRLYRAMLMHQAARREFGTLALSKNEWRELAGDRDLGLIFACLEGNRVDYLAMEKYPGLSKDFGLLALADSAENAANCPVINYLLHYLWPQVGTAGSGGAVAEEQMPVAEEQMPVAEEQMPVAEEQMPVVEEVAATVQAYWQQVLAGKAGAAESLAAARKLLTYIDPSSLRPLNNKLIYRGQLRYDLLYTAKALDEELVPEQTPEQPVGERGEPGAFNPSFNPHSDFYLGLKKLLAEFIADEENPYRLIAYYDEWDRSLHDYKKDWCKVREILLKPFNSKIVTRTLAENYGMITTLKRYFGMLRPDRFRRYGRQDDGEDIDIDAVIEAMVEREAGVSPAGGFYIRRDKRERDVAVGFLLDLSYSTEEVVPGTGKTLLDVEQEAVIVMAEALEVLGDKYAIYGFNSDGRDQVNFYVVKDFAETYSPEVKQRFGGLQSYGMTRLAAALRHATAKLAEVPAAIRILILLSDGRPFDFDYNSGLTKDYEQFYAETDTRMALREAKMKGINPFCITVDSKGQDYLEYIFGNISYIIIDDVNALPVKLTETYKNLTT